LPDAEKAASTAHLHRGASGCWPAALLWRHRATLPGLDIYWPRVNYEYLKHLASSNTVVSSHCNASSATKYVYILYSAELLIINTPEPKRWKASGTC
jgi:hypothetical protein